MDGFLNKYKEITTTKEIILYTVNIEEIDAALKSFIDHRLKSICYGKREIELKTIKKKFLKYLNSKNESNLLTGSISEFFIHLFLNYKEYKQEFLYFNLEENSIKKGFDGYYTREGVEWILESKSSKIPKQEHRYCINKAYCGLTDKINGTDSKNNPWEEAYNHASHRNVNSSDKLVNKLQKLSDLYEEETFDKIDNYNIITASTLFLEDNWDTIDSLKLNEIVKDYFEDKNFKKAVVICLNKKSIKHLQEYLKD